MVCVPQSDILTGPYYFSIIYRSANQVYFGVAESLPTEIKREVVLGTGLIFHVSPK